MTENKKFYLLINSLLIVSHLYFSLFAYKHFESRNQLQDANESCITNSFNVFNSEANINDKKEISEKTVRAQQVLKDNFYAAVQKISESLGLLFSTSSENNPKQLSEVTELTFPRSPPLI